MRLPATPAAALAALAALALVPTPATAVELNNVTSLSGTWASGSGNVTTGLDFFNPATATFTIPAVAGIAYSFTEDGFFEQSKYIYSPNATVNRCIKASLIWQHGTYVINSNGSLSLQPWQSDGKIMIIDACGAQTLTQYYYYQPELIPIWYSYIEPDSGFGANEATVQNANPAYALQLYQDGGDGHAGQKMSTLYLRMRPPNMLPTQALNEDVLNPAAIEGKSDKSSASAGLDKLRDIWGRRRSIYRP